MPSISLSGIAAGRTAVGIRAAMAPLILVKSAAACIVHADDILETHRF
jgi:uncharacterized membrane protein